MKRPKDLGIDIGTPERVFWTDMEEKMRDGIDNAKREIEINSHILILAQTRIAEEKEKLK